MVNLHDQSLKRDKAVQVAYYFIWKNQLDPQVVQFTKLKLQKLLYYAQAWNLVFNKSKLFEDEIEAWVHGPAIGKIYRLFKNYDFDKSLKTDDLNFDIFSSIEKKLLDEVWKVYGKYDGQYLEILTHNEVPWQDARKGISETESSQNIISTDLMKEYYGRRLEEAKAS
jgi:uncharacterized phage-associated protein